MSRICDGSRKAAEVADIVEEPVDSIERCEVILEEAVRVVCGQISVAAHEVVALIVCPDAGQRVLAADVFLYTVQQQRMRKRRRWKVLAIADVVYLLEPGHTEVMLRACTRCACVPLHICGHLLLCRLLSVPLATHQVAVLLSCCPRCLQPNAGFLLLLLPRAHCQPLPCWPLRQASLLCLSAEAAWKACVTQGMRLQMRMSAQHADARCTVGLKQVVRGVQCAPPFSRNKVCAVENGRSAPCNSLNRDTKIAV